MRKNVVHEDVGGLTTGRIAMSERDDTIVNGGPAIGATNLQRRVDTAINRLDVDTPEIQLVRDPGAVRTRPIFEVGGGRDGRSHPAGGAPLGLEHIAALKIPVTTIEYNDTPIRR